MQGEGKKIKHTSLPWKHYSSPTHPERKPYRTRPTLQELNKTHDSPTSLPVISQRMEHNAERCSENNYRNRIHCKQIKCNFTDKPVQMMMLEKLRNFIWIQYSVRFNTCFEIISHKQTSKHEGKYIITTVKQDPSTSILYHSTAPL